MEHARHAEHGVRRYARPGVAALVAGLSLYFLLPSLDAVFSSWRSLSRVRWYWAAPMLVAECASIVLLWQLDRIALKTKAWFPVACAQLSGNAVGRVVPGGGATATAVTVTLLGKAGISTGNATAAMAASTALQIGTAVALPLAAVPAILAGVPVPRSLALSAYLGLLVLALLVAVGALAFTTNRPLLLAGRIAERVLNTTVLRRRPIHGLPEKLLAERDFIRSTVGERWRAALLAAAGSTGFDYAALLFALLAVGAQPEPSLVLLAYTAAKLLALIPFTPGGLGFVEAGLVATLSVAGVPPRDAVVATFAYRLVAFWLPIPAGAVAYALFRRRYS